MQTTDANHDLIDDYFSDVSRGTNIVTLSRISEEISPRSSDNHLNREYLSASIRTNLTALNLALYEIENSSEGRSRKNNQVSSAVSVMKESIAQLSLICEQLTPNDQKKDSPSKVELINRRQVSESHHSFKYTSQSPSVIRQERSESLSSILLDLSPMDAYDSHSISDDRSLKGLEESEIHIAARNLKILVVEDSILIRKILRKYLLRLGCLVTIVANGDEGRKLLESPESKFDVVFSDFEMPTMGGVEMMVSFEAWLLSKAPSDFKPPFIIGMSASANESELQRAQNAGMDCFMMKPLFNDHICDLLGHYINGQISPVNANKLRQL